MTAEVKGHDDILMNPLRGHTFRLSSYVASSLLQGSRRNSAQSLVSGEYTISRMLMISTVYYISF